MREHHDSGNDEPVQSNGILNKLGKVSPLIVFAAGGLIAFAGSYFGQQQHTAQSEAELRQILVQHEESIRELKSDVAGIRKDVVPRTEHEAVIEKDREIARLLEKLYDERYARQEKR